MLESANLNKKLAKNTYKKLMAVFSEQMDAVQVASREAGLPVVILFEGWRLVGKGRIIKSLTRSLDPRGYRLYSVPPIQEYHTKFPWLRRFWKRIPAHGSWVLFDGSWYKRIMADRVREHIPEREWRQAYRDIVGFERTLVEDGYVLIKFFFHINKQTQKKRLDKLSGKRIATRSMVTDEWEQNRRYEDWLRAYEEAIDRTETEWGPWTVVESTNLRYARAKVGKTVVDTLARVLGLPILPIDLDQEFELWQLDDMADQAAPDETIVEEEPAPDPETGPNDHVNADSVPVMEALPDEPEKTPENKQE